MPVFPSAPFGAPGAPLIGSHEHRRNLAARIHAGMGGSLERILSHVMRSNLGTVTHWYRLLLDSPGDTIPLEIIDAIQTPWQHPYATPYVPVNPTSPPAEAPGERSERLSLRERALNTIKHWDPEKHPLEEFKFSSPEEELIDLRLRVRWLLEQVTFLEADRDAKEFLLTIHQRGGEILFRDLKKKLAIEMRTKLKGKVPEDALKLVEEALRDS